MIAACLAIAALAALLAYREYVHAQERKALVAERVDLAHTHAAERAELAQRIQAPEAAVVEHFGAAPNLSLGFDDDEQFWKAREERLNG